MRAGPRAIAASLAVLAACTGGEGFEGGVASTSSTSSTTVPATTATTPPATVPSTDPAGSVTLRVEGLTLPDLRAGGSGLRLLVHSASPRLTVRRAGGGGAVTVCPVAGPTAPVDAAGCAGLEPDSAVDMSFVGGVELRATAVDAPVGEVGVTYLPRDRSTTVVTPRRPAGACVTPCETTFSLLPGGAGPFTLDAGGGGGRPHFELRAAAPDGGPGRTLATVEGGGTLSIRSTVQAGWNATLFHQERGPDVAAAVVTEISWP